jgi:hypothetical protein
VDTEYRKMVQTTADGTTVKVGYMYSYSTTWRDPNTWTDNPGAYSISNFQACPVFSHIGNGYARTNSDDYHCWWNANGATAFQCEELCTELISAGCIGFTATAAAAASVKCTLYPTDCNAPAVPSTLSFDSSGITLEPKSTERGNWAGKSIQKGSGVIGTNKLLFVLAYRQSTAIIPGHTDGYQLLGQGDVQDENQNVFCNWATSDIPHHLCGAACDATSSDGCFAYKAIPIASTCMFYTTNCNTPPTTVDDDLRSRFLDITSTSPQLFTPSNDANGAWPSPVSLRLGPSPVFANYVYYRGNAYTTNENAVSFEGRELFSSAYTYGAVECQRQCDADVDCQSFSLCGDVSTC